MGMNPLDPQGLTAALAQSSGAQLAGYKALQDAAAKNLFSASHSPDMQAAINYPSAPSLNFSPNPSFSQGVGEGIGNYYALKNYRTRTEMLGNAVLEQRQREKQQQDMLTAAKDAENHNDMLQLGVIRDKYPNLADAYAYGDRKQRDAIWAKVGDNSGASYEGEASREKTRLTEAGKTDASLEDLKRRMDLLKGVDVSTPEGQNTFRAVMSFEPKTKTDIQQNQANLEGTQLSNAGKVVDNQINSLKLLQEYITTRYAEPNAVQDLRGKTLSGDLKSDELNRLQRLPEVVNAAMQRMQSGEGLSGPELLELQTTVNVLANKDPKFLETFKDFGFVKKDKAGNYALDQKNFDSFFKGQQPSNGLYGLKIQPAAQQGHLMQDPSSGKWYDTSQRDTHGYPVEVAAPANAAHNKPASTAPPKKPQANTPESLIDTVPLTPQQRGEAKRQLAIQQTVQTGENAVKGAAGLAKQVYNADKQRIIDKINAGKETQGFWGLPFNPADPLGIGSYIHGLGQ